MATKTDKKANVPNLRFPGFEDEWQKTTLGDCSSSFDYGMNAAATAFDGKNRYIRITDIDQDSSKYKPEAPVSPLGELADKYLVKENDILFARTGASTGKTYLYDRNDGILYFAGFLIRATISEAYNAKFIFAQTQTASYGKWVKLMSMRSGQPGINSQEYTSYQFLLPTRLEQDRIAHLLTLIDQRIQTQNKIIENLETLIKSLKARLFKQRLCFKTCETFSPWENAQLSKITVEVKDVVKDQANDIEVLTIASGTGFVRQEDRFNQVIAGQSLAKYTLLRKNEFSYNRGASKRFPFGCIYKLRKHDKALVPNIYISFAFNDNCCPEFYSQLFSDGFANSQLRQFISSSARLDGLLNINRSDFFSIKMPFPELSEQMKIGNFLSSIDNKIEKEVRVLKLYQEQKKYLLQRMFI